MSRMPDSRGGGFVSGGGVRKYGKREHDPAPRPARGGMKYRSPEPRRAHGGYGFGTGREERYAERGHGGGGGGGGRDAPGQAYEDGYRRGLEEGKKRAYDAGYDDGYDKGYRKAKGLYQEIEKIFVGGLPFNCLEEEIHDYFRQFGNVLDVSILKDRKTGSPRGFAYVSFENPKSVKLVLQEKDKHYIRDKWVDCSPYDGKAGGNRDENGEPTEMGTQELRAEIGLEPPKPAEGADKIFVGGLPPHCLEEEVLEYFIQYGEVIDVSLITDKNTGENRGFGYVQFADPSAVEMVVADREKHHIRDKWIDCSVYSQKAGRSGQKGGGKGKGKGKGKGGRR